MIGAILLLGQITQQNFRFHAGIGTELTSSGQVLGANIWSAFASVVGILLLVSAFRGNRKHIKSVGNKESEKTEVTLTD